MILQKLVAFYEHKKEQGEIASYGWERKAIPFLIQINEDGSFASLIETGIDAQHAGRIFTIPKTIERPGKNAWKTAFFLWDHIGYALGLVANKEKGETAEKQHSSFIQKLDDLPNLVKQDKGIQAVIKFLNNADFSGIQESEYWDDLYKKKPNVTFQLSSEPDSIITDRPIVRRYVTESANSVDKNAVEGKCLVTGSTSALARTHPKIKGVTGKNAQSSGVAIVSFNDTAYTSFGKKQNYNAPVSQYAAFAYTTALDYLLKKDSIHKLQIGDISTVFWADKSHPIENALNQLFSMNINAEDSPRDLDSIRSLLTSPKTGAKTVLDDKTKFYVLGLSPNASRLSIRFWCHTTVKEMAERILNYFDDIEITMPPNWQNFPSLKRLLNSVALLQKSDNLPPQLAGEFIRAIFEGKKYPRYALNLALNRGRSELKEEAFPYRIGLIKAILIRTYEINKEELTVSLNKDMKDIGYRLGRLFCVLERVQEDAHDRALNRTIRESHYTAASTLPGTVFHQLIGLSKHHLKKLKSKGNLGAWKAYEYEKIIIEIMDGVQVSASNEAYPIRFNLKQQGLFAVGYYHQRQTGFPKKQSTDKKQGE